MIVTIRIVAMVITQRHNMSVSVVAIVFIADRVILPSCIDFFPAMETRQPRGIQG